MNGSEDSPDGVAATQAHYISQKGRGAFCAGQRPPPAGAPFSPEAPRILDQTRARRCSICAAVELERAGLPVSSAPAATLIAPTIGTALRGSPFELRDNSAHREQTRRDTVQ